MPSRATELLRRLEHLGEPVLHEDDDDDTGGEGDEGEEAVAGMPQQQQDAPVVPPNNPFSKEQRNPNGSMKTNQNQEPIDDSGKRGFMVRRGR